MIKSLVPVLVIIPLGLYQRGRWQSGSEGRVGVSIEQDVQELIGATDAPAVVDFEVCAKTYDPGNMFATGFTRICGIMLVAFLLP